MKRGKRGEGGREWVLVGRKREREGGRERGGGRGEASAELAS